MDLFDLWALLGVTNIFAGMGISQTSKIIMNGMPNQYSVSEEGNNLVTNNREGKRQRSNDVLRSDATNCGAVVSDGLALLYKCIQKHMAIIVDDRYSSEGRAALENGGILPSRPEEGSDADHLTVKGYIWPDVEQRRLRWKNTHNKELKVGEILEMGVKDGPSKKGRPSDNRTFM